MSLFYLPRTGITLFIYVHIDQFRPGIGVVKIVLLRGQCLAKSVLLLTQESVLTSCPYECSPQNENIASAFSRLARSLRFCHMTLDVTQHITSRYIQQVNRLLQFHLSVTHLVMLQTHRSPCQSHTYTDHITYESSYRTQVCSRSHDPNTQSSCLRASYTVFFYVVFHDCRWNLHLLSRTRVHPSFPCALSNHLTVSTGLKWHPPLTTCLLTINQHSFIFVSLLLHSSFIRSFYSLRSAFLAVLLPIMVFMSFSLSY